MVIRISFNTNVLGVIFYRIRFIVDSSCAYCKTIFYVFFFFSQTKSERVFDVQRVRGQLLPLPTDFTVPRRRQVLRTNVIVISVYLRFINVYK